MVHLFVEINGCCHNTSEQPPADLVEDLGETWCQSYLAMSQAGRSSCSRMPQLASPCTTLAAILNPISCER